MPRNLIYTRQTKLKVYFPLFFTKDYANSLQFLPTSEFSECPVNMGELEKLAWSGEKMVISSA